MEKNAKLAPLQASLRQVAIFLHNADFYRLRRSKMPANASGTTIRLLRWFWLIYKYKAKCEKVLRRTLFMQK